ncbi:MULTISPECIES: HAD family hydrolase [Eubacteriales]|uniref:HAD family hydrolase n=1 Tax=Eubacteriales TaxID=186802 RepID=UPI001106AE03|nr:MULTISPECIES: HAD family hydrolase [Eubacteriales]
MKEYKYILFDLDGTVTDPGVGITGSVMYALKGFGIEETDRTKLYRFIGPPLADSFRDFYGFTPEEARRGIKLYREYYKDRGIFENKVYEGMEEMLAELKRRGKTLVLATSKPEYFARQILEHFGLTRYFAYAAGATMDETRVGKDEVIAYAMDCCNITDPAQVLMVGDRFHDVEGARANSVDSLGVLYGYGSRQELSQAGADYLAETVEDILTIIK